MTGLPLRTIPASKLEPGLLQPALGLTEAERRADRTLAARSLLEPAADSSGCRRECRCYGGGNTAYCALGRSAHRNGDVRRVRPSRVICQTVGMGRTIPVWICPGRFDRCAAGRRTAGRGCPPTCPGNALIGAALLLAQTSIAASATALLSEQLAPWALEASAPALVTTLCLWLSRPTAALLVGATTVATSHADMDHDHDRRVRNRTNVRRRPRTNCPGWSVRNP